MTTRAPLLDISGFDRTAALSPDEREALTALGWQLRRRRSHDPALPQWRSIQRLVTPLDAARLAVRDRPDTQLHRRSSLDAAGLVLSRCMEEGTAYWGWPEEAWVRLIGEDRHAFARPWPGWVDQTVRPYVVAYGYLLCDFGAFHRLGAFNRIALVERVFGREAVGAVLDAIFSKLEGWGYRRAGADERLRTVVVQALLVNRSARLEDLTTESVATPVQRPAHGLAPQHIPLHPSCRGRLGLRGTTGAAAQGPAHDRAGGARGLDGMGRALERDLDAHPRGASHASWHPRHGRTVDDGGAARNHLASGLDARNLRCLGRASHTCRHWRLRAAQGHPDQAYRATARPGHGRRLHCRDPDVFPRLPGVGLVRAPFRSLVRARHSA